MKERGRFQNPFAKLGGSSKGLRRVKGDKIAFGFFLVGLASLSWGYGVLSHKYILFPYNVIQSTLTTFEGLVGETTTSSDNFAYREPVIPTLSLETPLPDFVDLGMTLVYGAGENKQIFMRVLDYSGRTFLERSFDVFAIWDNFDHLPVDIRPQSSPGGEIAGLVLMDNGDLVFNFEPAGLVRTTYCGDVIWKLDVPTHHAVTLGENGHFYAVARKFSDEADPDWPSVLPRFQEDLIVEIGQDGKVLKETSIFDILRENDLLSVIYESARTHFGAEVTGDIMHMNDIEVFPSTLAEGVFKHGDLMVSLRNANKILVFDPETLKIRYLYEGTVIRQHDPDFIDGDHMSIFDNHSLVEPTLFRNERPHNVSSRIVMVDARNDTSQVYFEGNDNIPLFTDIMGKHQWLSNGNLLVTESRWGRVFELTTDLEVAWEFNNVMQTGEDKGRVGFIYEAMRLDPKFNRGFFEKLNLGCEVSP